MRSILGVVQRAGRLLGTVERCACIALVAEITVVMLLSVVARYVTKTQLPWAAEIASYSLAWTTFIAAAIVTDRRGHLGLEGFVRLLPASLRKVARTLSYLVVLATLIIFVQAGFELVLKTRSQLSAAMRIPVAWAYLSIPVGCILMFVHSLEQFLAFLVEGGE